MGAKKPEQEEAPKYTGEGFIPLTELTNIVTVWQQRHELCEEVDLLESKGGKLSLNRLKLALERAQDRC